MEKTVENLLPIILLFVSSGVFFAWDILRQRERSNLKAKKLFCLLILICFVCVFVQITLIGRESRLPRRIWIIPFYSYYKYLSGWQVFLFKQNIQNILLFMPLGFFGSVLLGRQAHKKRRLILVGSGLLLSVIVEVMQYVMAIGLFEVDDLIHNTFGTSLGCLVYNTICCLRLHKDKDDKWKLACENQKQFMKNVKVLAVIVGVYLVMTLVAYANHLYHVHVLWQ